MSYSGYTEYLCVKGHHTSFDVYDSPYSNGDYSDGCAVCREKLTHRHNVDETNGSDPNDPWTVSAPKKEIGFDDKWRRDHYNNRYAIKVLLYAPLNDHTDWKKI
jgi:hypothetical protein